MNHFKRIFKKNITELRFKKGDSKETAFYTKQVKTRCHGCGKIGHRKEVCWESESNKDKQPSYWKKNYKKEQKMKKEQKYIRIQYCMLEM